MRNDKWISFIIGTVLTFLLSFACGGCIATAFDLGSLADITQLALWCALLAIVSNLLPTLSVAWLTPCLLAALGGILWQYAALGESVKALLHTISVYCDKGYDCGILRWSDFNPKGVDRTMAIQAICSIVAMFTGWCICERRGAVLAIASAVVALAPCTLVLFSVPDVEYLFIWLSVIVLLLLSQGVRRQNEREGNRLTLMIAVPTAIAAVLLFALLPQNEYDGRERAEQLLAKFEQYFDLDGLNRGTVRYVSVVNLKNEGSRNNARSKVMDVTASKSGAYYLRGRAYEIYTGLQWQEGEDSETLPWQPSGAFIAYLRIHTVAELPIVYFPYYSQELQEEGVGASKENTQKLTQYSIACYESGSFSSALPYDADDFEEMTALPDETLAWAKQYLLDEIGNVEYFPELIADHVRNQARYDLSTPKMREIYTDFAQWFLTESDRGYCVHFATATTVLLRAAGIPARYVTGYLVEARTEEQTNVYQTDAHAWVEYWTEENGWQIIDPTPSSDSNITSDSSTQSTQSTSGEEATEPTEQTEDSTKDTEETSQSTAPSEDDVTEGMPSTTVGNEDLNDADESQASQQGKESLYDSAKLIQIAIWSAVVIALIVSIIVQWKIRAGRFKRKLAKCTENEKVLLYWRVISRYARLLEITRDESAYRLVCKAKFSQHTMTETEVLYMERLMQRYILKLRKRPLCRRIYDRLILALY